jgi:N-acetylmuramoyl-L-alanine amidase
MSNKNDLFCVLNVGHSKKSRGAWNPLFYVSEYSLNETLAAMIADNLRGKVVIVYQDRLTDLPDKINALNPAFTISLHCNSYGSTATGTETLYFYTGFKSKKIAQILQRHLVECLKLKDRGIKPIKPQGRGGFLLNNLRSPAVIAKPFFISNDSDLMTVQKNWYGLIYAYVDAINEIFACIQQPNKNKPLTRNPRPGG